MLVFVKGGRLKEPEKNPRSQDENQQQTQRSCTFAVRSGVVNPDLTPPPPPFKSAGGPNPL